jgi:hypothetical protein
MYNMKEPHGVLGLPDEDDEMGNWVPEAVVDQLEQRIARLEAALWVERSTRLALERHGRKDVRGEDKEAVLTTAYLQLQDEGLLSSNAVNSPVKDD